MALPKIYFLLLKNVYTDVAPGNILFGENEFAHLTELGNVGIILLEPVLFNIRSCELPVIIFENVYVSFVATFFSNVLVFQLITDPVKTYTIVLLRQLT